MLDGETLPEWIEKHRSGVYVMEDRYRLLARCVPCGKLLKLHRANSTLYIHLHEKNPRHCNNLDRLKKTDAFPVSQPATSSPCTGASVRRGGGYMLCRILDSLHCWHRHGCIAATPRDGETDVLSQCRWEVHQDTLLLRSTRCTQTAAPGCPCCRTCAALANNRKLCETVSAWAYRIDLTDLAIDVCYGTDETVRERQQELRGRDYRKEDLAGKDLSALLELPNDQLISTIRRKVESVAGYRRSASLQAFLDGRISKLRVCFHDDVQKTAFATLMHRFRAAVANGEAFPEDLRLGSMIAAGALRGDIVVDALLKSYLCKKDKEKRGCVRTGTGKFFGEDAAHEIAFSLGIAQECRSVLQLFGVSKKVVPRAFVRTENMHLLTFLFYLHLSDSPHTCILYHPVGVQAAWMNPHEVLRHRNPEP